MKRFILFACIMILIISISGCSNLLRKNNSEDIETPILPGDTSEQKPIACMVYFKLSNQDYLIGQNHLVSVPDTKRIEEIIIQELIFGPKIKASSLKPVINPNTEIVSVSDNDGLLFVTLSSHFLDPPTGAPDNWQDDEEWVKIVLSQRKLALDALVNTITQIGKYSKLQLYIDYNDTEQGRRPTRYEVGFLDDNSDQLLEPIGRNTSVIFGPDTAAIKFLDSFSEKNWEQAASFIDLKDQNTNSGDVASEFSILDLTLIDYEITSLTTSYDGKSAIITIDYFMKSKDSVEYRNTNVSLLINLSADIWKVSNVSISQLLNVSNG